MVTAEGFLQAREENWNTPLEGNVMYVVWQKLRRLQPVIKERSKPLNGIKKQIDKAREDLSKAQQELILDRMNIAKIDRTKGLTKKIIELCNIEEQLLREKAKIH